MLTEVESCSCRYKASKFWNKLPLKGAIFIIYANVEVRKNKTVRKNCALHISYIDVSTAKYKNSTFFIHRIK